MNIDVNEIHTEQDALDQSIALNRITLALLDEQKVTNKRLFIGLIVSLLISLFMFVGLLVFINQFEVEEEIERTTVYTQEVDGESASINNVSGDQYTGNSVHNDWGGD